ncbi:MAG TPA: hypothetical protein VFH26_10865 [Gemmatimonadales bacterium]|nr:hypothetical protein [Gemmatimonadales bacterium]
MVERRRTTFLGHYGVALALKRAEPKVSLGTLFLAAQLADLLWGAFLLLGWERARIVPGYTPVTPFEFLYYPISHSLVAAILWGVAAAALYYSWPTRDTARHWQAAALVGLAVFSHYPLDVLVHVPDLPLAGQDSPKLGLGLWNYPTATIVAELLVFGAGLAIYVAFRSHRHPVRTPRLALVALLLVGTYFASRYGPLPPNMTAVAVSDIAFVIVIAAVAAWADRRATPQELEARRLSPR